MFHLLVSYNGWPEHTGSISTNRIYFSENPHKQYLYQNAQGALNIDELRKHPALLVTEIGGDGPQYARIAQIISVAHTAGEVVINYVIDRAIKPISNDDLEELAPSLGISRVRLMHTHWDFKDADLFKTLLLHQQQQNPVQMVFSVDGLKQPNHRLVSVMMPFGTEFSAVYATIQVSVGAAGLTAIRADNFWEHTHIIQDIVNLITKARIVICDLSQRNPNVFYEAGIAHALGKEVILLAQSHDDVPFDLRHIRYIRYLNNAQGLSEMSQAVQARIETIIGVST
jgi:hypothetical protein